MGQGRGAGEERFEALDLLRGGAALGILIMNVRLFAEPDSLTFNPFALGTPARLDLLIWSAAHLLVDLKFLTIFALLFGAGTALMREHIVTAGGSPAPVHYRRMAWLLVFGLVHAYLLWDGDILRLYAICGAAVFPALRLKTRTLFTLAIALFAVGSVLGVVAGEALKTAPAPVVREWSAFWQPSASQVAREIDVFRSGWLTQLPTRAHRAFEFESFDMWLLDVWRVSGLMLAGVGLFRLGVLTGHRSRSFYLRLALIGFGVGLPVVWLGLRQNQASRWAFVDAYFIGSQWNYWGSVAVALGWIGLILFIWRAGIAPSLRRRLTAVGRMAFSSYIAETLLCTFIFYGTGLGLFGRVSRAGQLAIVVAIWSLLLVAAPFWLARFRIGPLEWFWRRLTYGPSRSPASRVTLPT